MAAMETNIVLPKQDAWTLLAAIRQAIVSPYAAYALLATAALLWSGSFIAGRLLSGEASPVTLSFYRWLIAALVLVAIGWPQLGRARAAIRREWKLIALAGLTGMATFHTCAFFSVRHTSPINAVLILSVAPIAIMVLSWLVNGSRFQIMQKVGAIVSLAGAALVVLRGDPTAILRLQANLGDLWMLAAVPIWAVYSIVLQRRPSDLSPFDFLAASAVAAVLWMLPLHLFEVALGTGGFAPNFANLVGIGYLSVVASVLAFFFWARGVAAIGASRAGQFMHLMPLFAAILSVVVLGDAIATYHVVGAALVFTGIALAQGVARIGTRVR
jgi:drug/metabolite transporter (DMT)-like permease